MKRIIGYSGHVPHRNDNVGVTAGESLRMSQENVQPSRGGKAPFGVLTSGPPLDKNRDRDLSPTEQLA